MFILYQTPTQSLVKLNVLHSVDTTGFMLLVIKCLKKNIRDGDISSKRGFRCYIVSQTRCDCRLNPLQKLIRKSVYLKFPSLHSLNKLAKLKSPDCFHGRYFQSDESSVYCETAPTVPFVSLKNDRKHPRHVRGRTNFLTSGALPR